MKDKVKVKEKHLGGTYIISKSTPPQKRLIVCIPMTGLLRAEWVMARYGQVVPCNWSLVEHIEWVNTTSPMQFLVADARNLCVNRALEGGYEWLIFVDHDVCLHPMFLVWMNEYMVKKQYPVISGLYFTKSVPAEPLVYRGRGTGYYADWKIGDKVWVDGLPMGCTLIHRSVLEAFADEAETINVMGRNVKKVFESPTRVFYDPETNELRTSVGTEDLEFCTQVMKRDILGKAGWKTLSKKEYPFLIDTKMFCYHIEPNGVKYPAMGEHTKFLTPKQRKIAAQLGY